MPALGAVCYQIVAVLAWWVGLRVVVAPGVAEEVRLFAYLCLWTGVVGVLFLGYQVLLGYLHLVSLLRQAEAD